MDVLCSREWFFFGLVEVSEGLPKASIVDSTRSLGFALSFPMTRLGILLLVAAFLPCGASSASGRVASDAYAQAVASLSTQSPGIGVTGNRRPKSNDAGPPGGVGSGPGSGG